MEQPKLRGLSTSSTFAVLALVAVSRAFLYDFIANAHGSTSALTLASLWLAAAIALGVHQPWRARSKLTDRDIARIVFNGALLAICTFLAVYCVRVMGTIRSILLDYADIVVLSFIGWIYGRLRRGTATSTLLLALCGTALVLWYNPSAAQSDAEARHAARRIALTTAANSRFAPPPPGSALGSLGGAGGSGVDLTAQPAGGGLLLQTGGGAPPALASAPPARATVPPPLPLGRVVGKPTDEPALRPPQPRGGGAGGRHLLALPQMQPPRVQSGGARRAGRPIGRAPLPFAPRQEPVPLPPQQQQQQQPPGGQQAPLPPLALRAAAAAAQGAPGMPAAPAAQGGPGVPAFPPAHPGAPPAAAGAAAAGGFGQAMRPNSRFAGMPKPPLPPLPAAAAVPGGAPAGGSRGAPVPAPSGLPPAPAVAVPPPPAPPAPEVVDPELQVPSRAFEAPPAPGEAAPQLLPGEADEISGAAEGLLDDGAAAAALAPPPPPIDPAAQNPVPIAVQIAEQMAARAAEAAKAAAAAAAPLSEQDKILAEAAAEEAAEAAAESAAAAFRGGGEGYQLPEGVEAPAPPAAQQHSLFEPANERRGAQTVLSNATHLRSRAARIAAALRAAQERGRRSLLLGAARVKAVLEAHSQGSVLLAGVLLGAAAWLATLRRTLQRSIAADTGLGPRRTHAYVLAVAAVLFTPVTLLHGLLLGIFTSVAVGLPPTLTPAAALLLAQQQAAAAGGLPGGPADAPWAPGDAPVGVHLSPSPAEAAAALLSQQAGAVPLDSWAHFLALAAGVAFLALLMAEYALELSVFGARGAAPAAPQLLGKPGDDGLGGSSAALAAAAGVLPGGASALSATTAARVVAADASTIRVFMLSASTGAAVLIHTASQLWALRAAVAGEDDEPPHLQPAEVTLALVIGGIAYVVGAAGLSGSNLPLALRLASGAETPADALAQLYAGGGGGRAGGKGLAHGGAEASSSGGSQGSCEAIVARIAGSALESLGGSSLSAGSGSGGGSTSSEAAFVSFVALTRRVLEGVWEDGNSRRIFAFLCINLSFMFVEIVVGWLSNSLGLISDAGHMFFDNASLFIGLYAAYMARWKPDAVYTYGYARYEVLAGFVNAIFLVFVGVSVVFEALERLWEPPEIHGEHVLPVAVVGLLVNIVGLIFFHDSAHGHAHGGSGGGSHGHSHGGDGGNENMYGVYLHVLADAFGSIGVICSSLLIKFFGWQLADPIASIAISALILASVVPLLQTTVAPLLSRTPEHLEKRLAAAVQGVGALPAVERVEATHFWRLHGSAVIGTARVVTRPGADSQLVLQAARAVFKAAGVTLPTIEVRVPQPPAGGAAPAAAVAALTQGGEAYAIGDALRLVAAATAAGGGGGCSVADHDSHGHAHDSHGHAHGPTGGCSSADHDSHGHAHDSHGHAHDSHGHSHGPSGGCSGDELGSHGHAHVGAPDDASAPQLPPDDGHHGHSHGGGVPCSGHSHADPEPQI